MNTLQKEAHARLLSMLPVRTHARVERPSQVDRVTVTPEMVVEMKRLKDRKWSRQAIASKFRISTGSVSNYLRYRK